MAGQRLRGVYLAQPHALWLLPVWAASGPLAPATPAWMAMRLGTGHPCVGKSPAWAAGRWAAGLGHRTLLRNWRPRGLSRRQCPPGKRVQPQEGGMFPERCPQANAGESGRWGWDSPLPEPHSPHPARGRNSSSSLRGPAEPEGW